MVDFYNTIVGKKPENVLTGPGAAWIDVRDLAKAHVLAAQKAEAGGERIIISRGLYPSSCTPHNAHEDGHRVALLAGN